MSNFFSKIKQKISGFFKNPSFYFGAFSFVLLANLFCNCESLANLTYLQKSDSVFNPFFKNVALADDGNLFLGKSQELTLETPDLKTVDNNSISAISTPRVLTTQTLGDLFGNNNQNKKDVINYTVQPGDTPQSIADSFNVSLNTLLWANDITQNSTLKVGQTLTVLPVSGVIHIVKSGDTVADVAKTYKANAQDIISFNDLSNEADIYVGDTLVVPGGVIPRKAPQVIQAPLADNYFIFPLLDFKITQGLHYYNAVDIAPVSGCGTPVYAAASGVVQRAVGDGGWHGGMGNHVTILHPNGVVTYYGHLMTVFAKPGDQVDTGQRVGLVGGAPGMAGAGDSTGCHVHFQVVGAKNPLSKYFTGTIINETKQ